MDFTRNPIIETIICPKEGCKLVVRSSKNAGQEEFFVDAVEIVSFGNNLFYRSLEKPKPFLVPVNDYEILEVREAKMVLKNVALSRTIKIAGGKETESKSKEHVISKSEEESEKTAPVHAETKTAQEARLERRRRRQYKRRRGGKEEEEDTTQETSAKVILPPPDFGMKGSEEELEEIKRIPTLTRPTLQSLLTPPPKLIRETIGQYKEDDLFKNAFFEKGEEGDLVQREIEEHEKVNELLEEEEDFLSSSESIPIEQPKYGSFPETPEEEEETYHIRKKLHEDEPQPEEEELEQENENITSEVPFFDTSSYENSEENE